MEHPIEACHCSGTELKLPLPPPQSTRTPLQIRQMKFVKHEIAFGTCGGKEGIVSEWGFPREIKGREGGIAFGYVLWGSRGSLTSCC